MTSATRIRRRPDRDRLAPGFTLIELLVVLALLGVLSGLVVPRFGGTTRSLEVEEAARRLQSELQRLRVDAMREGRRIEVEFSADGAPTLVVNEFAPPRRPAWDFVPVTRAERRAGLRSSSIDFGLEGSVHAEPGRIVFHADGTSSEGSIVVRGVSGRTFSLVVRSRRVVLDEVPGDRS